MATTTPYVTLKEAIAKLEKEQLVKRDLLKEQFKATVESLTPFSFLKKALTGIGESPEIRGNLLSVLLPLAAGFITKKAFAGTRRFNLLQQAGILLLDGLNKYITQNPEIINSFGKIVGKAFHKKNKDEKPED